MAPAPPPVIVVGAGLAGLAASISALRAGAQSVVLLERAAKPGGNSIKASSGINGAPTKYQKRAEPDTAFFADTVKSAGKRLALHAEEAQQREKLISVLTGNSKDAVGFLSDEIGVDLSVVALLGGHSVPRTHRGGGKTPPGAAIVTALLGKLNLDKRFELRTSAEVTGLLAAADARGRQAVTGVEFRAGDETATLHGPVVFAAGGFAGDANGMLAQHRPDLAGIPSTNDARPGMHRLLTAVGAELVDMDSVQIHPTGFVDPAARSATVKFLAAEMLRGEGGILLHQGRRFTNELGTREVVSGEIMALPPTTSSENDAGEGGQTRQWDIQLLLDPGACEAAAGHMGFYLWKGLVAKKKVKDLDAATQQTIKDYAAMVAAGGPDPLGRTHFGHWRLKGGPEEDEEEVCIGSVTPVVHFTMGGAVINEKSQVLASGLAQGDQAPIGGLFAAGEITGGIHGDNRLGGSSLLECVVFGRIAGEQAAQYAAEGAAES
ncbi:FAD dependent oxidoreductase [Thozetella sp. PMI_491]|nr:FAD dependent oxidoreductase [Thozetella sp. PMI_491]